MDGYDDGDLLKGDKDTKRKYTQRPHKTNDVLEMILDLEKKQLKYICNDEDFGIAYDNIEDTSYRAVVSFYSEKDSIQCVGYSHRAAASADRDYFDPEHHHHDYTLSDNNTTISKVTNGSGNVFLSKVARNGVHRWKFKLSTPGFRVLNTTLTIGIWKANQPLDTSELLCEGPNYQGKFYGLQAGDGKLTVGDGEEERDYTEKKYTDDDIIEMILDLNKKELRFIWNSTDCGVAFKMLKIHHIELLFHFMMRIIP